MEEQINYKSNERTQSIKNKPQKENNSIKIFSEIDDKSKITRNTKIEDKGDFEKVFEVETHEQLTDLIENFNLSKVTQYVDSAIRNPENTVIIMINPKKALMEMLDSNEENTRYNFKLSKFNKMWEIILELSQEIKSRETEMETWGIELYSPIMVINRLKIFFVGKNLEYLMEITSPITKENEDKIKLPIIEKCMRFSQNKEQMDLHNCIYQLKDSLENNQYVFPESKSQGEG